MAYEYLFISLLAGLYFKLDVFLLNFLKGEEAVGIYTSGYKFLEAFVFLAVSYNFVAMPQFAKLQKLGTNALRMRINKDLRILLSVGILVAFAAFVAFPIILPYVLQGEYLRAITVSQIVIFALPLILIYSIFLNTLYVLEKAHIAVLIFASQAGFNLVLNLIYIPRYSFVASSYITVFGEALNVIITFVLVQKYLRKI
ncbi:polysaccharide biosynthesis C-terminal domain-containing protein [Candidatus Roizmanbacteria bacterium]|nr:polysaccharide biosynthesis C-terminal domain-containing protein [Candidatus Roizmanbacteria bacterium]